MSGEGPYLSAVVPFGYSDFTGEGLLRLYKQMGCRTIQVQRHPEATPGAKDLKRKVEDAGLVVDSLHGRFGRDLDPSSASAAVRAETIRVAIADAAYMAELGGGFVVLHPSTTGETTDVVERRGRLVDFLNELAGPASDYGVRFVLENLPPEYPLGGDALDLVEVLRRVDREVFGLILDTGHANMAADVAGQFRLMMEEGLSAMHVHDNLGSLDNHLWPGEGSLDWGLVSDRVGVLGAIPLAVELFPTERELAERVGRGEGEAVKRLLGLGF
ncbi:sugar phosphate isomerase/epimerase family protein [Mucisphaera sp.]|uniref:sugar phosphate isomerase/epimerase family protein n=1 Tax=Mucisphaera sp. TaxID=2913024 RepID=UPI003D0DD5FC